MTYTGGPMTEAMYYVLLALLNPNHGYQLMHSISEVSDGRIKMGPEHYMACFRACKKTV
ncbi:hypothetical protein QNH10_07720 [Sporosarcina thermotolerans]|uniref:hypothetical protein n=1 Tax=Sporosarcina thermotolerans TaxID=633404 RepID=UPI0024BD062B|nr:hypothetical protein [Sporosarcina thermotolerans]WHT49417.1 hypothetical protein QNH10_07720 [Sporosarcina thermotolerans]